MSAAGGDATSDALADLFHEPVRSVGSVSPVQDFLTLLKTHGEDKVKLSMFYVSQ